MLPTELRFVFPPHSSECTETSPDFQPHHHLTALFPDGSYLPCRMRHAFVANSPANIATVALIKVRPLFLPSEQTSWSIPQTHVYQKQMSRQGVRVPRKHKGIHSPLRCDHGAVIHSTLIRPQTHHQDGASAWGNNTESR